MITAGLCKWHTSSPPSPPRRRPSRTVMARRCDKHPVPPLHIVPLPGMLTSSDGMLSTPSHKLCSSIHLYTYPPNCCFFATTCSLFFLCSRLPTQYSSLACFSVHSVRPSAWCHIFLLHFIYSSTHLYTIHPTKIALAQPPAFLVLMFQVTFNSVLLTCPFFSTLCQSSSAKCHIFLIQFIQCSSTHLCTNPFYTCIILWSQYWTLY